MTMPAEQVLSTGAQGASTNSRGFIVKARDIDVMGYVDNVVYAQWIQDVAVKHLK